MRVLIDPRRPPSPGARLAAAELTELYGFPRARRWVRANFVSTLDGSATGPDGLSGSINTPADNRVFALQRDLADAVLVGAGTVRAEGYERLEPTRRSPVPATLVAVSRSGRVPEGLRTPTDGRGHGLLVTCEAAGAAALDRARSVLGEASVLVHGDADVDLPGALDALADRGLRHVLCEGGPSLFASALAAGVVDEVALSLAPTLVGGDGPRVTHGPDLTGLAVRPHVLVEESGTLMGLWRVRRG